MSMNKFRNSMMSLAGLLFSNAGFATTGIVTQIDNANNLVQVKISEAFEDQPELVTGWIPVLSPWSGNEYGMFAPPDYNDLVLLIFAEGNVQNPLAAMRIFNDEDKPLNVPSGEFWLVHKTGTFIKLTNNGKLGLNGNIEIDLTSPQINITCATECKIDAPSIKIGNTGATLNKLITDSLIDAYNNHVHPTPSGTSSPPTVPLTSANATTATEAN